jgi:hypothetical protein
MELMTDRAIRRPTRDVYAAMAPGPEETDGFWALRQAGLQTTRSRRRGFRYWGLRISAVLVGLSGTLGVWLGAKFLGTDVGTLAALPLPSYGALALGAPALLELIRPEPPASAKRKGRKLAWLTIFVAVAVLVALSQPGAEKNVGPWLIPALLYLAIAFVARLWQRRKLSRGAPGKASLRQASLGQANLGKTSPAPTSRSPGTFAPENSAGTNPQRVLLARGLGLTEAIFWLIAVGILPAFLWQAIAFQGTSRARDALVASLAVVFALGVSGVLGALGAIAERLSPRFPRLLAGLILFGPFVVSLWFPECPSLVGAILAANRYIASEATAHWGLI